MYNLYMFYYKILWKSTCIYTHWLGYMLSKTSVLPYQRWLNGHFLKNDIITYCAIFLESKGFYKKKLLPRNVWSELCKCLLTWIWPQWTTMFLFLLYSCFLLFILWGSVLKKIIMLANSYIHKKDISIVYVYHVNLVKLYTIYHRKMMLLFFFLCIHIKGLVFLLANMVNYWMCCWWLILLSHVTWWPLSWWLNDVRGQGDRGLWGAWHRKVIVAGNLNPRNQVPFPMTP